jgi:hypothetical protein
MKSQVISSAARFVLVAVVVLAPPLVHKAATPRCPSSSTPAPTQADGAVVMDGAVTWGRLAARCCRSARCACCRSARGERLQVEVRPITTELEAEQQVAPAPRQQPIGLP